MPINKIDLFGSPIGDLGFSSATYSTSEGSGSVIVTVQRTNGFFGEVSVHYETSNSTATAGIDYTAVSGILTWENNDITDKTFSVPILDDAIMFQGSHAFNITLSNPTGGANLGPVFGCTVPIAENDLDSTPPTFFGELLFTPSSGNYIQSSVTISAELIDNQSVVSGAVLTHQYGLNNAMTITGSAPNWIATKSISGLSGATQYIFGVTATSSGGNSSYGGTKTVDIAAPVIQGSLPYASSAIRHNAQPNQINVFCGDWYKPSGVASYKAYANGSLVYTGASKTFVHGGLTWNQSFHYEFKVIDNFGVEWNTSEGCNGDTYWQQN